MLFPPSLSAEVLERSFHTPNGELGVSSYDTEAFLRACEADRIEVLGWELWLVDEDGGIHGAVPSWASLAGQSVIYSGAGDASQTRMDIASLTLEKEIKPQWLPQVRFNFTLAE